MVNQQLIDYIKRQQGQGFKGEEIRKVLIQAGWQEKDIEEAFVMTGLSKSFVPQLQSEPIPPKPEQPTSSYQEESSKKILPIIFSIILVLIIIGAGVFAYFYFFKKPLTPEQVTEKMIENMMKVKTSEFSGQFIFKETGNHFIGYNYDKNGDNLAITIPTPIYETGTREMVLDFSGVNDSNDINNQKLESNYNIKETYDYPGAPKDISTRMKFIDNIIYFKIDNAYFFEQPEFPAFLKDIGWIKIDFKEIGEMMGQLGSNLGDPVDQEEIDEIQEKIDESLAISSEKLREISEMISQLKILKFEEALSDKRINNTDVYHYIYTIDAYEILELMGKLSKEMNLLEQDEWLKQKEKALKDPEFLELVERLEDMQVEIWIGKKDFLPYRISFNSNYKDTSDLEAEINFVMEFKNYNKPVQIEVPSSFKSIKEVIFDIMTGYMNSPGGAILENEMNWYDD